MYEKIYELLCLGGKKKKKKEIEYEKLPLG